MLVGASLLGALLKVDAARTNCDERRRFLCPAPSIMVGYFPKYSGQWEMGVSTKDAVGSSPRRIRGSSLRNQF